MKSDGKNLWVAWFVVGPMFSLSLLTGCGSGPLDWLAPDENQALLDAPGITMPATGATSLANTTWEGQASCTMTGDMSFLVNGGGFPEYMTLQFDSKGIPTNLDSLGVMGFSTGWGGPVLKRADFTANSFDLAYTTTMSMSYLGVASYDMSAVMTVNGTLSADGQQLTGQDNLTYWTSVSAELEGQSYQVGQQCNFTLTRKTSN